MNYKKLFGYGALVWATAYILSMALFGYHVLNTWPGRLALAAIPMIVAYFLARSMNPDSIRMILKYAVSWVLIVVVLDLLFTVPYTGMAIFYDWQLWAGYLLVVLASVFVVKDSKW